MLCSEESIKFKVVRQKAQGESPILATKPRKIQHAFVRAKGRHKGQEDVGGKENYINEKMSHHVLFSQLD